MSSSNESAGEFLLNLGPGRKISIQPGDDREAIFLFQRLSILIQLFSAILPYDSFVKDG